MMPYPRLDVDYWMKMINSTQLNVGAASLQGQAIWSADGRILAYTDAKGLWLWDALLTNSLPRLLIAPSEAAPIPLAFSSGGRYLKIERNGVRSHLDLSNIELTIPDGIISPDERTILVYDTTATSPFSLTLSTLVPYYHPINYPHLQDVLAAGWLTPQYFAYAKCGEGTFHTDAPEFEKDWCMVFTSAHQANDVEWIPGYDFDYQEQTGDLVTLVDGDTITINGEIIELGGQVDGEIVEVQWLSSLLYMR